HAERFGGRGEIEGGPGRKHDRGNNSRRPRRRLQPGIRLQLQHVFLWFQPSDSTVEQIRKIGLRPGFQHEATVTVATERTGTADRAGCPECDEPGRDEPGAYPVRAEGPRVGGTNSGRGAEKVRAGCIDIVLRSTATK